MPESKVLYLSQDKIDKKKWDECIAHSINELPYAYAWYLDTVCYNWDALVLNNYEAVLPLTWRRKAGIYYLYQPFFTQQLGVFSIQKTTSELINIFLENIPEKFKLIEINLNADNNYSGNSFSVKKKLTHHLLLNKNHEKIISGYNENTKRNLKKAQKENLSVTDDVSPETLISLFQENQGKRVMEIKSKDYERLKNLMTSAIKNNSGKVVAVKDNNRQICAAGFFVRSKRFVINVFPSSNEAGRKNGAMFLLMDSLLKNYENTHLIFDFEGSEIPSISTFYKGFGSQEVFYPFIRRNNLPCWMKILKK